MAALIKRVHADCEAIDALHYNAASMREASILDQPQNTFASDLTVNIGGALVAIQAVAPLMFERGEGSILLTGGGGGDALNPMPQFLSLSIGKAGIRVLAQGLFEEFKAKSARGHGDGSRDRHTRIGRSQGSCRSVLGTAKSAARSVVMGGAISDVKAKA